LDVAAKATMLVDATIPEENRGIRAISVRIYHTTAEVDSYLWEAGNQVISRLIDLRIPKHKIIGRRPDSKEYIVGEPFFINLDTDGTRNPSSEAMNIAKESETIGNFPQLIDNKDFAKLSVATQFSLLYRTIDIWIEYNIVADESVIAQSLETKGGSKSNHTTKNKNLENMREFYRNLNADFDSVVLVQDIEDDG